MKAVSTSFFRLCVLVHINIRTLYVFHALSTRGWTRQHAVYNQSTLWRSLVSVHVIFPMWSCPLAFPPHQSFLVKILCTLQCFFARSLTILFVNTQALLMTLICCCFFLPPPPVIPKVVAHLLCIVQQPTPSPFESPAVMCNMLRRHVAHRLYSAGFIPSQETSFQGQNKVCRVVPHIGQALKEQGAFSARQPVANKRAVKGGWETSREKETKSSGNGRILLPVWFLAGGCCMVSWVSLALDIEGHTTKNNFYCFVNSVPKFYWPRPLSVQLLLLCYILRRVTVFGWIKSSENLSKSKRGRALPFVTSSIFDKVSTYNTETNADLYIEHLSFLSQLEACNGTRFLFAEHPGAKIEAISSVAVTYTVISARPIFFFHSLNGQFQLTLKNAMIHLVKRMST